MLPTHAYIPGVTARHPESAFDDLKNSVTADQSVLQLQQSAAFRAGLAFLDEGYYWETHEVLEPVWMVLPAGSTEKKFIQGLIQLANGRLKLLMQRHAAALRLVDIARGLMPEDTSEKVMTLETTTVLTWIDDLERDINSSL